MDRLPAERVIRGIGAAPGQGTGPVMIYRRPAPPPPPVPIAPATIGGEQARVLAALDAARAELEAFATEVEASVGPDEAAIFTAQSLMATDPEIVDRAAELVAHDLLPADAAILQATAEQAAILQSLDDPYLQERAADLRDVGTRAARLARGEDAPADLRHLPGPAILVADDLVPSETVRLDRAQVQGIALSGGGPTSHAAVVARALGLPLVCGLGPLEGMTADTPALVDGDTGQLILYPSAVRLTAFRAAQAARQQQQATDVAERDLPAITPDGHTMRLVANAGSLAEAEAAIAAGARGLGLLRTEFLFMDRAPDEEEQQAAYAAIYAAFPIEAEVVIRTMDLGGDKPPPYLDFTGEANPFLGWRGIRIGLDQPDFLQTQVRAILRAGAGRTVQIMFPMISTLDELRQGRALVEAVRQELATTGVPHAFAVQLGVMIEVPAAVLIAPALAAEADFFSIGTNDLTQYTMAADRGASRVAHLYSPIQPAVLQLIARTVEAGHAAGRPVGMCGEAAGNPAWTALWLGLGLDELSMTPPALPAVKAAIRRTPRAAAQALAQTALQQSTLADMTALLGRET